MVAGHAGSQQNEAEHLLMCADQPRTLTDPSG
jgi:hypothetical protein